MRVWQQFERISRSLHPSAKHGVKQVLPFFLERYQYFHDPARLHKAATLALSRRFPGVSAAEMDLLAFYLIGIAAGVEHGEAVDSMSEMGEMESLRLQMAMDRQSKLMTTLSNLLKKVSDTSQSITQNIK